MCLYIIKIYVSILSLNLLKKQQTQTLDWFDCSLMENLCIKVWNVYNSSY